jgi:hypothetical protein
MLVSKYVGKNVGSEVTRWAGGALEARRNVTGHECH